jgi:hypothetical protein
MTRPSVVGEHTVTDADGMDGEHRETPPTVADGGQKGRIS